MSISNASNCSAPNVSRYPASNGDNQSYFTSTNIDQRIYAANGGAELLPITLLPRIIHIQHQSIKNLIAKGQFPIPIVKFAGRNYVKTETLVKYLQDCERAAVGPRKLVGRKSNRERAEAAQLAGGPQ